MNVYDSVGGERFFVDLVERFYELVEAEPVLRPLYPDDLSRGKDHLAQFLAQYWGGPPNYSAQFGDPRLRMRHAPFVIGRPERDAWFTHMATVVRDSGLDAEVEQEMLDYFDTASTHMINTGLAQFSER